MMLSILLQESKSVTFPKCQTPALTEAASMCLPQVFSGLLNAEVKMAAHTVSYVTAAASEPTRMTSLIT